MANHEEESFEKDSLNSGIQKSLQRKTDDSSQDIDVPIKRLKYAGDSQIEDFIADEGLSRSKREFQEYEFSEEPPTISSKDDRPYTDVNSDWGIIHKRTFKSTSWPAYDFSCRHIDSLYGKTCTMLTECDVKARQLEMLYSERIYKDVTVLAVGVAGKCVSEKFDNTKFGNDYSEIKSEDISVAALEEQLKEVMTTDPIVLVANESDVERILQFCDIFSLTKPLIVLLQNSSENKDYNSAKQELATEHLVCSTPNKSMLDCMDDLLERFAFDVVREISETLNAFNNAYLDAAKQTIGLNDVTLLNYERRLQAAGLTFACDQSISTTEMMRKHIQNVTKSTNCLSEIQSSIKWMYIRSKVPNSERLVFDSAADKEQIDEKTCRKVLSNDKVVACGKQYDVLHVYLDEASTTDEATEEAITDMLTQEGVQKFSIHYTSKSLHTCSEIGAKVGTRPCGTLGCFAWKTNLESRQPTEDSREMCALLSKHVAEKYIEIDKKHLLLKGNNVYGRLLEPLGGAGTPDIAAALIERAEIHQFDTNFRDEYGTLKPCILFDLKTQSINTLTSEVYMRGSASILSFGTIRHDKYFMKNERNEIIQIPLIAIENRSGNDPNTMPFCKDGDSGAVVCASDSRRKNVYAIAMLMGKRQTASNDNVVHVAFGLKSGLDNLSEIHKDEFTLCDSGATNRGVVQVT